MLFLIFAMSLCCFYVYSANIRLYLAASKHVMPLHLLSILFPLKDYAHKANHKSSSKVSLICFHLLAFVSELHVPERTFSRRLWNSLLNQNGLCRMYIFTNYFACSGIKLQTLAFQPCNLNLAMSNG